MLVIPSVDIKGGKCVRLSQGRADQETVYSEDPVAMAARWEAEGGELLHVVDLDGAFQGRPVQSDLVRQIVDRLTIPVELGGGLRSRDAVAEAIELGVERVILGTAAVQQPDWVARLCAEFPDKILVSIDAKKGKATTDGWVGGSSVDAIDLARRMGACGVRAIIFTDIATDGMLVGPNFAALAQLTQAVAVPVIASGGIGCLDHVARLSSMGLEGAILGRALYTGDVKLSEAIQVARNRP